MRSLTSGAVKADVRAGTTTIAATIGGLKPYTTYYFRLFASNTAGTAGSRILKFTTGSAQANVAPAPQRELPRPPSILTEMAGGAHVDQSSQRNSR